MYFSPSKNLNSIQKFSQENHFNFSTSQLRRINQKPKITKFFENNYRCNNIIKKQNFLWAIKKAQLQMDFFHNKTLPKALRRSTSLAFPPSSPPPPPMAAEMPSSASPPLPIPPYPIFIDTNLDTHLALGIFWDDTVADLKRNRFPHRSFPSNRVFTCSIQTKMISLCILLFLVCDLVVWFVVWFFCLLIFVDRFFLCGSLDVPELIFDLVEQEK